MYTEQFLKSLSTLKSPCNSTDDIISWVQEKNHKTMVNIKETTLSSQSDWFYDEEKGTIHNQKNSFFQIAGIKEGDIQQPILLQNEIGYLGFIAKEIDGVLHFLIQAKIEPGNINCIQLSPTIQATRSNFMQLHGGKKPAYLDYFANAEKYEIIVDQIQSEQSARFLKKRNRNIVILVNEDIEVLENFRFITLGQLKQLLHVDNLVNMDTRTVLSCLKLNPTLEHKKYFKNIPLFNSMIARPDYVSMYHNLNNCKMYEDYDLSVCPLSELNEWTFDDKGGRCKNDYPFDVIYCDIEIEGREVRKWTQPLFRAKGIATFALFYYVEDNIEKYVIQLKHEIGCFDGVELAPTLQVEAGAEGEVPTILFDLLESKSKRIDVLLSEEGGRFYHEQNRNCLVEISKSEAENIIALDPKHYVTATYSTLNILIQANNVLNIQLRNLLSLMEI